MMLPKIYAIVLIGTVVGAINLTMSCCQSPAGRVTGKEIPSKVITSGSSAWVPKSNKIDINLTAVSFLDSRTAFGITREDSGFGVYKSEDAGLLWAYVSRIENVVPKSVLFTSHTEGFIIGQSDEQGCIVKTADGGKTWKPVFSSKMRLFRRSLSMQKALALQ